MESRWTNWINRQNLSRASSLANVLLFLVIAGLLPSGTRATLLVNGLLGLWAAFTLLYFAVKKRYVSFLLFLVFFALFFTAPLWLN